MNIAEAANYEQIESLRDWIIERLNLARDLLPNDSVIHAIGLLLESICGSSRRQNQFQPQENCCQQT